MEGLNLDRQPPFRADFRASKTARVMLVLLESGQGSDNALTARQIQRYTAQDQCHAPLEADDVHRILNRLSDRDRISRAKGLRGKRVYGNTHQSKFSYFWLTSAQARSAASYRHIVAAQNDLHRHLEAVDIPARLSYLCGLKARPALSEDAMLDLIIADYKAALSEQTMEPFAEASGGRSASGRRLQVPAGRTAARRP